MKTSTYVLCLILALLIGAGARLVIDRSFGHPDSAIRTPQSALPPVAPTPTPSPEPAHVPFYQLPTPDPLPTVAEEPLKVRETNLVDHAAALAIATPTPAFTPDPEVLAYVNAALAQRPWMQVNDQWVSGLPLPEQTTLIFRAEPKVEREGDTWKITFKP